MLITCSLQLVTNDSAEPILSREQPIRGLMPMSYLPMLAWANWSIPIPMFKAGFQPVVCNALTWKIAEKCSTCVFYHKKRLINCLFRFWSACLGLLYILEYFIVRLVRFVLLLLLFNFVIHCIISTVVVAFEINYLILSYRKPCLRWVWQVGCRVLSLSDCKYSLNPLSQTRIDQLGRYRIRWTFKLSCSWRVC